MFSKFTHILARIGTLFLSMAELCPMVWICYLLFTCSPNAGGHLGCFHVLSVWNTSLWTFCTFLCWHMFTFLVCMSLRVEWVGHMVTLYITFWGIAKLFPKRWQRFPFPSSTFENSDCCILTFTCYLLSVRFSHLSGCDVVSHCDFDSHNQLYI